MNFFFYSLPERLKFFHWLSAMLCILPSLIYGQGAIGIANKNSDPIRLNVVRPELTLPNAQTPPYEWSAAYLRNTLSSSREELEVFLLDSSLCGNGLSGGDGFTDHLKVFYTYNNDNQLAEVTYKHLRVGEGFENFSRKIYEYENGQRSLYTFQVWDTDNWKDDYQERYDYDAQGRWKEFRSREQNDAGEWEFVRREQIAYDDEGNAKMFVVSEGNGMEWTPAQRLEASFNENGFYTKIYRQIMSGAAWDTVAIETATFDGENEVWRGYLLEEKNPSTGEFEKSFREYYTYNLRGFWTRMLRQEWNEESGKWQNAVRELFEYTRRGAWIGWTQQTWQDGAWVNHVRQEYIPTPEGQIDRVQTWDSNTEAWVNSLRNIAKFDEDRNLEREVGTQEWDASSEAWQTRPETRSCAHSWSPATITSIDRPMPRLNCAIANPYSLRTPIYCESLEVGKTYQIDMMDTQGRSVYQTKVRGGQNFSVDRPIANGLYYIRIQEGGQLKHIQKLLVRQ